MNESYDQFSEMKLINEAGKKAIIALLTSKPDGKQVHSAYLNLQICHFYFL